MIRYNQRKMIFKKSFCNYITWSLIMKSFSVLFKDILCGESGMTGLVRLRTIRQRCVISILLADWSEFFLKDVRRCNNPIVSKMYKKQEKSHASIYCSYFSDKIDIFFGFMCLDILLMSSWNISVIIFFVLVHFRLNFVTFFRFFFYRTLA